MFLDLLRYGLEHFGYFYGKYKAIVKSNTDPLSLGRIQLHSPQVHGDQHPLVWAHPSSPYAGKGFGFWSVPDVDEWVWVSFDHGDPAYPIYEGGWWGQGDTTSDMTTKTVCLVTKEGLKLVFDRTKHQITVVAPKVVIQATEVDITANVTITGNGTVIGDWTATGVTSGHHTHPLGPNPLIPTETIALPNPD